MRIVLIYSIKVHQICSYRFYILILIQIGTCLTLLLPSYPNFTYDKICDLVQTTPPSGPLILKSDFFKDIP